MTEKTPPSPLIIGVRHHSPACARLVAAQIHALKPRHVLIEGPADFNPRIDELYLPHRLPLAIYSFFSSNGPLDDRRASWSPFAEHSPEWQALQVARQVGAQARFIDLPAWHDAFADTLNRYADADDEAHEARTAAYERALCDKLAIDSRDALWDHLFEGELPLTELADRLQTYFIHLRADDPGSIGNQAREWMMARWIAWAMAQGDGPVLVVCGGYHAPALAKLWRDCPAQAGQSPPDVPAPNANVHGVATFGSYLVPYHNKRLDAFTGYASGMSSPAYYQWVWEHGAAGAGEHALKAILTRLRQKRLPSSTADLIAIHTHALGLARLRGHTVPLRSDWLDAVATALIKQALDVPLPWTYRGPIRPGTDPALVEMMDVLSGDASGALAPGTPQPPLVLAVDQELARLGIPLNGTLDLNLLAQDDRLKSRVLHRLTLLAIPGIHRESGPDLAMGRGQQECWQLRTSLEQRAALIEAAVYGATLEDAARNRLEEILQQVAPGSSRIAVLAGALNRAAFAGLPVVSSRLLDELPASIAQEGHFDAFGEPLQVLFTLYRHGESLGMVGSALLQTAVSAAFDRALWLLEATGSVPPEQQLAHIQAFQAIRLIVRDALATQPGSQPTLPALEPDRALAVCRRKAQAVDAAAVSRGAALGLVLSLSPESDSQPDASALLQSLPTAHIGDALAGLLALAREQLTQDRAFVSTLDSLIGTLDGADFLQALPAIRGAFAWLPTQERAALAEAILSLYQAPPISRRSLLAELPTLSAESLATHLQLEQTAVDKLASWGITLIPPQRDAISTLN
ncbi:DUF5682 family protein [Chitinivorax sp. B]|uniref:DUF5682 family protein n=1 Tax=Chitinivorax sp. B TaxID=2502235 RepID=UPI0010F8DFD4|nr:DUF5682 family protein [Chitinivorax sp. B]